MSVLPPLRLLVCGSRDYYDTNRMTSILCQIHEKRPVTFLCQGMARGADKMARDWATMRGVPVEDYPVDTRIDGPWPAAGIRRNIRMGTLFKPNGAVAFFGPNYTGSGTMHMANWCKKNGVPIAEIWD